jgi:hypothetical protein
MKKTHSQAVAIGSAAAALLTLAAALATARERRKREPGRDADDVTARSDQSKAETTRREKVWKILNNLTRLRSDFLNIEARCDVCYMIHEKADAFEATINKVYEETEKANGEITIERFITLRDYVLYGNKPKGEIEFEDFLNECETLATRLDNTAEDLHKRTNQCIVTLKKKYIENEEFKTQAQSKRNDTKPKGIYARMNAI